MVQEMNLIWQGGDHGFLNGTNVTLTNGGAILYRLARGSDLPREVEAVGATERDVIVANVGAWGVKGGITNDSLYDDIAALLASSPALCIWRESFPSHFKNPEWHAGDAGCVARPLQDEAHWSRLAKIKGNVAALPRMRREGVPILPVWEASRQMAFGHPGKEDCGHWCEGGLFEGWVNPALFRLLDGYGWRGGVGECQAFTGTTRSARSSNLPSSISMSYRSTMLACIVTVLFVVLIRSRIRPEKRSGAA